MPKTSPGQQRASPCTTRGPRPGQPCTDCTDCTPRCPRAEASRLCQALPDSARLCQALPRALAAAGRWPGTEPVPPEPGPRIHSAFHSFRPFRSSIHRHSLSFFLARFHANSHSFRRSGGGAAGPQLVHLAIERSWEEGRAGLSLRAELSSISPGPVRGAPGLAPGARALGHQGAVRTSHRRKETFRPQGAPNAQTQE